ncbi:serine/threonine-protein kinase [Archangium primigenium]|uniref:serine/threonine-protein kinase n=1 Tax=[Archangium] primigenium TaxID=2792470 RepID=UPI001956DFAE|nr:serine/threonine-protein kinase [Archangium primigenium]MBM7119337.1 protein kinase [Archangium primigenium]
MSDPRTCETCGLAVPVDTDICPRDGTVLLNFTAEPSVTAPSGTPRTSPGKNVHVMEDLSTQDPLVGLKVGEYELGQRIGVGGMGLVYDGIQPLIGKRVAVKVLRPELAAAEEQVARLLAEARAVNAIRHRGIVDIFGFGQVPDGRQYIIMEFLEGVALDAHLAERGRLAVHEVLDILDEVLSALGAAHGAGVVHRDLKPSNVFLVRQPDGSRYVKLLDFGLAKMGLPAGRTAQTRTDMVVGTPEYMAPEQARGQPVGPMTDLYSLGVVAFEMITGRLPFTGSSPVDLLMKHVDAKPPRPSEFLPGLPAALDAFILQMLTKDPEARPGAAEQLRRQLHRLRESLLAQAEPPAPVPVRPQTPEPPQLPSMTGLEALPALEPLNPDSFQGSTPPAPSVLDIEEPPEPVVPADEPPRRKLWPLGLGALGLLALGAAVAVLGMPTPPPAAPVQPVAPPPVAVAPPVQATPPAKTEPEPKPAPVEPEIEPLVATRPEPTPAPTPTEEPAAAPKRPAAPTPFVLQGRIRKLDRAVLTRMEAGESISPASRTTLEALRGRTTPTASADELRQVSKELDDWERMFLRRK